MMSHSHTFHIPVMGTGFTIDTPIKVARYGISSVISLVDDTLIEQMRRYYCESLGYPYEPLTKYDHDYRARRITAYLDLVDHIVKKQFEELKSSAFELGSEITKYFELLPISSPLKRMYQKMLHTGDLKEKQILQDQLRNSIQVGDINVNIMTKLDRPNFSAKDDSPLPAEYTDAMAALRGYANSTLHSAIVFSAGINQRLYSYVAEFKDFYADASGFIKKKVILKVSDYRSSLIQGKFFAKKGIWVSEYRVESGLNCGGHAFATTGHLLGPILEEFKIKKQELIQSLHAIYNQAIQLKNHIPFGKPHEVKITAQGGIGTAKEDRFLRTHYQLDGTGWGTPFLLCPEATNVDDTTLQKLAAAGEDDLYLSDVSPLGVPFNNLRDNSSDAEKQRRYEAGRPGSSCPKGHLAANTEFTEKPICTASRLYQKLKLDTFTQEHLSDEERQQKIEQVVRKACICNDLGEGVLIKNEVPAKSKRFSAVCPGPNLAYFSKIVSLKEIVGHIYGRLSILNSTYRPNMFIKELGLYVDYLVREVKKALPQINEKQVQYFAEFKENLLKGMAYYQDLFPKMLAESQEYHRKALEELERIQLRLEQFAQDHRQIFSSSPQTEKTVAQKTESVSVP
jgi:hypothetical protein